MSQRTRTYEIDYYARRERQERAVAERAVTDAAREIHLDLAARYAALRRA